MPERFILPHMILPHECPPNEIHVEQVGVTWKVVQRDRPIEDFEKFAAAITHAAERVRTLIGDGHQQTLAIIVKPPASPWMRE